VHFRPKVPNPPSGIYLLEDKTASVRSNTPFHSLYPQVLHFDEWNYRSPFSSTPDSDLYSTTAEPNYDDYNLSMNKSPLTGMIVHVSIIFSIDIPMICLAIYAVYSLIKSKRAAAVFVMNLLISDLIQVVSVLLLNVRNDYWWNTALITWTWTSLTGLYFMYSSREIHSDRSSHLAQVSSLTQMSCVYVT